MITVYSKPNCMQCDFTKKFLVDNDIPYTLIDTQKNPEALEHVKSLGFQSLPVVEIEGEEPFFGFRPDRLMVFIKDEEAE
ncbi:TPA: glutaredoxin-like protein NrdH [Streptococcus suis]